MADLKKAITDVIEQLFDKDKELNELLIDRITSRCVVNFRDALLDFMSFKKNTQDCTLAKARSIEFYIDDNDDDDDNQKAVLACVDEAWKGLIDYLEVAAHSSEVCDKGLTKGE